ncbi:DUF429 domain-containing protein [Acidilobus sp.]|jgi:predicted nuclease with RNAse H fold|uniref:DUF429 domain-containing protein n=1 Tax=Acidilobus sp. TaxID=1872109 RepID=UPI003D075BA1
MPSFVGIDLAASPKRVTGLAVVRGRSVSTKSTHTDEEILNFIVAEFPEVVALDSPLSLGRGPFRDFELAAVSKGFRLLPLTMRSMRSLAIRGMRIAHALSSLGIKVIETHPTSAVKSSGCADVHDIIRSLDLEVVPGSMSNRHEVDAAVAALAAMCYSARTYYSFKGLEGELVLLPEGLCKGACDSVRPRL